MGDTVISVEHLSKSYLISHESSRPQTYETLRETVTRNIRNFGRKALDAARGHQIVEGDTTEEFWALKDVSFEVKRGEVLGIIGRNGAGKSTLLKVLSRITEPTKGRARIRGRVASLLEVGTGFHPELTGRENIFLNGTILGMTQQEIRRKFDEIVAFAEVEKFLDTPVKRYSSGMYVRLAFAVAAHLEPEILVIDEVLAVGDAEFQKRCLGKMSEVARGGRTVLFVSHQLHAVSNLCSAVCRMDHGQIVSSGSAGEVIQAYLSDMERTGPRDHQKLGTALYLNEFKCAKPVVRSGECQKIALSVTATKATTIRCIQVLVYSEFGDRVGILDLRKIGICEMPVASGDLEIDLDLRDVPLTPGRYRLGLYVQDADHLSNYHDLAVLTVEDAPAAQGFIPSAPQYRGVVEFDFSGGFGGSAHRMIDRA